MYLKSLELHGFKSFPDRTVLKFNNGTTIIVGPNGSGKSNITDAMRWVLGELSSKNIRGSKMEDVIFAGTDDKKPMSFAEVSVTFDDSEEPRTLDSPFEEVTVTRRYYRSGDSEYFINRQKCRLKDIYELFMNTGIGREGYSIIGQGRIAEIISKKSEDRRGIFEESAGIARFRYRKNESEKKLAETESNMERVSDIEHELAARIGPLEKDAEKARRYLELYGEKKKTDVSLWLYDSERMKLAIAKSENDVQMSAHELEMAEDSLNITSAQIERLYEQSHDNKEAARRNYEVTKEATRSMNEAESEGKLLLRERQHAETSLVSEEGQLDGVRRQIAQETERLAEIEKRLAETEENYNAAQKQFDELDAERLSLGETIRERNERLEEMLAEQKTAENGLTDLKVRLNVLENSISTQKQRRASIRADIQKYEDEIAALDQTAQASEDQIKAYQAAVDEINEKTAGIEAEINAKREKFAAADRSAGQKQAEIDSLDSRITALLRMQEHFDGYNNSIKYVMNEAKAGRLTGIRGPLSYLVKVEESYLVAIETSLGAALQNIVTDDEAAAKRSIESLKKNNAGRATFYPITTIRAQERGRDYDGLERVNGFVGWADELVSCDEEYRQIVRSLLARVVVFDTLDHATDAARSRNWKIRCVTLDGQQINAGGSFTGGQTRRDSGMLSRTTQIDALKRERAAAEKELGKLQKEARRLDEETAALTADIRDEEERRGLMEVLISAEQKTFSDADGKRQALRELVGNMENDTRAMDESSRGSADDLERMQKAIDAAAEQIAGIAAARTELAEVRGEEELREADLTESVNECRIRLAELTRDRESGESLRTETKERLTAAENEFAAHTEAIGAWQEKIRTLAEDAETRQQTAESLRGQIDSLTEEQKKLESAGDELETRITALRQTEKDQTNKKELVFIAHSKNESRLEALKNEEEKLAARMWEDYELTYAAAMRFAEENDCHTIVDGERTQWVNAQNELKGKIRSLGHVNVDAIEEFNDVKKRYDHIRVQLSDLEASKADLMNILEGIETDMKRMFLEAFEKINTYFGEVFRELFGGGHAEVVLSDPENVLESGIEINAAPPGKTIKNLNLLSGGEQAFIAIALLFALIRVNPSPFCIFDEIEAALDEVNVTRVGRYIKKYSKEMQIIMISHRRGTMDIADTLYGVTMPQSGVSRVFTLGASDDKEALLK